MWVGLRVLQDSNMDRQGDDDANHGTKRELNAACVYVRSRADEIFNVGNIG